MIFTGNLDYKNKRASTRLVQIEPWAQEFIIKPESRLRLEVVSSCPGPFEVYEYENSTSIWVWSPSTARVFIDGVEHTTPFMGEPFPPTP